MDVPSVVWLPVISGYCVSLQHTPLAVTAAPPSEIILPPDVAVVLVISVTSVVVTEGRATGVVKVISPP